MQTTPAGEEVPAKWTNKERLLRAQRATNSFAQFFQESQLLHAWKDPESLRFTFGNPCEEPLPELVAAFREGVEPKRNDWFAYVMNEDESSAAVLKSLHEDYAPQQGFVKDDLWVTTGAIAGLTITFQALLELGDEVLFITPKWFMYECQITVAGGVPVPVPMRPDTFGLDLEAIERAVSPKTRAIVINTPHNPSGHIYSEEELDGLAAVLTAASERNGRAIYIVADEAYKKVVFPGHKHISPLHHYAHTIVVYTYAKTLLCPGQRCGYLALSPRIPLPEREELRPTITLLMNLNWTYANGPIQFILANLHSLGIDMEQYKAKRDFMLAGLRGIGYECYEPQGTFYFLVRCPIPDDKEFFRWLAEDKVLVLPGCTVELPGFFRICLTPPMTTIEKSLPFFERALQRARNQEGANKA